MDVYWVAEVGGAALACTVAAAVTTQVVANTIDPMLALGIGMVAGIAAAANRQARVSHAQYVEERTAADSELEPESTLELEGETRENA